MSGEWEWQHNSVLLKLVAEDLQVKLVEANESGSGYDHVEW